MKECLEVYYEGRIEIDPVSSILEMGFYRYIEKVTIDEPFHLRIMQRGNR